MPTLYMDYWIPVVRQALTLKREPNSHDVHAVAVLRGERESETAELGRDWKFHEPTGCIYVDKECRCDLLDMYIYKANHIYLQRAAYQLYCNIISESCAT